MLTCLISLLHLTSKRRWQGSPLMRRHMQCQLGTWLLLMMERVVRTEAFCNLHAALC